MKTKSFLFAPIVALMLTSCGQTGVHHAEAEYIAGSLQYHDNFKILQLTDTHLGDKDDLDVHFNFMDSVIKEAGADMIVVTGDVFTFASKRTVVSFCEFMERYGLPWTVTWGNHDEQCFFSIDWLTGYLNGFGRHCLFKDLQDDDVTGNSNFVINLMDGSNLFEQLIVMDSNRYCFDGYFGYDCFKQDQIDWYARVVNPTVKSMMFYHIPLPEIDLAYNYGIESHQIEGVKKETTCPPKRNSGMFAKIKEIGSTNAMFFGHDHINDFHIEYEGVIFSYGLKSTNRVYFDEDMTGGQVITLKNDHSVEINRIVKKYSEVKQYE